VVFFDIILEKFLGKKFEKMGNWITFEIYSTSSIVRSTASPTVVFH